MGSHCIRCTPTRGLLLKRDLLNGVLTTFGNLVLLVSVPFPPVPANISYQIRSCIGATREPELVTFQPVQKHSELTTRGTFRHIQLGGIPRVQWQTAVGCRPIHTQYRRIGLKMQSVSRDDLSLLKGLARQLLVSLKTAVNLHCRLPDGNR